ncbi:tape measure protein [Comamonas terrae]|uniref:Tape measure protein n=1 Tax=Comamonas terrae TaxID=673548 RepID=A0ABW5US07_9BURK|nr:tape measure protein [Comamonas terrae]
MAEKVGEIYYDVTLDLDQMIKDQRRAQQNLDKTADSLQRLTPLAAAAKAALSGLAVMKIIDMADEWGQYAIRIKQATQSAEEYAYVQDRMLASANATFRSIQETRESFIQLSPVLREMGLSLSQSIDVIDTFSGLLVVNAASAEKSKTAMEALAKSLQKGKVDADAWMSIYSTVDSVVDIIAASSKKSATEIRKLGAEGKLGVEMFVQALADGSSKVAQQVKEMPTTVKDAMRSVANALSEYVGQANQAYGITATISSVLQTLGENFNAVADVALVAVTAGLARYVAGVTVASVATAAKAAASMRAVVAEVALAEAQVAETAASLAQARALSGVAISHSQVTAAAMAHEAATKRLAVAQAALVASSATVGAAIRGVLAFLTGPAGLAIAAGVAAFALMDFKAKADKTAAGLVDLQKPIDDVIAKFKELNSLQRERVINLQAAEVKQQAAEVRGAFEEMLSAFQASMGSSGLEAAKFRAAFKREMWAVASDASLSSGQMADAMKGVIDRWADGMGWSEKLRSSMITQAAAFVDLDGKQRKSIATHRELTAANLELIGVVNQSAIAVSNAAKGTAEGNAAADKQIESLKRQIALFGKASTAAGIYYDLENGALKEASTERRAEMKSLADQLAALEKRKKAQDSLKSAEKFDSKSYLLGLSADAVVSELAKIDAEERTALSKHHKLLEERKLKTEEYEQGITLIKEKYAIQRAKLNEDVLGGFSNAAQEAQKARDDLTRQSHEMGNALKESVMTPLERMNAELAKFRSLLASEDIDGTTFGRLVEKAKKEYQENLNQMDQFTVRFAQNVQDQLGDTIYESLTGSFSNIGKAWGQMLLKMGSQAVAADLARTLFGGAVAGGSGSGLFGSAVSAIGNFLGLSGKRENGGRVGAGKMYEVNERDVPELLTVGNKQLLMMAGQSGNVTPLDGMNVASVPSPEGRGGEGAAAAPIINMKFIGAPSEPEVRQRSSGPGQFDVEVIFKQIDNRIGEGIASGSGATYRALTGRFPGLKHS